MVPPHLLAARQHVRNSPSNNANPASNSLLNMRVKDPSEINWQKLGEPELDKHGSRAIRTRWKDMLADTLYNLGPQTTLQGSCPPA